MNRTILFVIVLCCCVLQSKAQVNTIDSIVKAEMQKQHIVGLSLGIVKGGKVYLSKGYGFANLKDSIKATDKTVLKIGSLSKQFIATCIMQLSEQGKLGLSDHINKYLKDAPVEWNDITIRHLLMHTSGIERESPLFSFMKRQPDSLLIQAVYKDKLHFTPGTKWEYSNMGYFILADIIRKVSGHSFEDYTNNFFATCHMTHTTTTTISKEKDRAMGYNYNNGTGKATDAIDFVALRPSGAFSSNIPDLIKWDSILRVGGLLTRQDWSKMWEDTVRLKAVTTGTVEYYGYGWFVNQYKGHRLVHHGGNTLGFTSEDWRFVDDKISIIILANGNEVPLGKLVAKIAATLDADFKLTVIKVADADKYLGVYSNKQLGMKITITNDEGVLTAQATGQPSFPLESKGKDMFKFDAAGIELDFDTIKNEMILKQGVGMYTFIKEK